ncbi:MAG: DUF1016 N-terminal domain-containing protein [Prevotellaceae bacterium]|nr:DUF1016 N-terminal domain-containing protein [Prevotellaceae bacterium]
MLSWNHYIEILKADNDLKISFYVEQTEKENWNVRELKCQMKSMLFHRLALGKGKICCNIIPVRYESIIDYTNTKG